MLLPDGARLDGGPRDGGRFDGGPDFDAGPDFDGGHELDGGDAGDGGGDAGMRWDASGRDAEPPVGGPPDPTTCRIVPEIHPFDDPVLETRWPERGGTMSDPASWHVCATPLVIDLTPNDGEDLEPVVVFVSYDSLGSGSEYGTLRIWDPRTETTISYPTATGPMGPFGPLEPSTNLAAGDLDGDGDNEIVGMGVDSGTFAFHHDGTLMWESAYPSALERGTRWSRTIGGAISLADLEGDGTVEVVIGRTVLEGRTGAHRWTAPSATTTRGANDILGPISCVADLDGDGEQEIVAGRTAMRANGSVMWAQTAMGDGLCAIADMGFNPGPEIVLVSQGFLYVLDGRTGEIKWDRVIEGRGRDALGGAPTVADFDGDGRPEIGVAHGAAYGVYDLDCDRRRPEIGCGGVGVRWTSNTEDDSSAATGSSVFDFNGDGRAEVVYNDQFFFRVYDGYAGTELFRQMNSSRTRTENPVIADVDSDGDAEIVFTANSEATFLQRPTDRTTDPGVEIWGDARGRWVGARRIWNQHAYHITNVTEGGHIRSPEPGSWTVLNAYRQNLREGGDVLVVPDLWGGRGQYECVGRGRARVRIDVQNWGLERVGAGVVVRVYRGRPSAGMVVAQAETTGVLLPNGGSETVEVEIALSGDVVDYWAVVDDPEEPAGGAIAECREGNNEVLIWRPACP
ncbi:Hemolysin-related protein RbmC [Sandaracinus amylolyticus]|uniref:Hemolysin-related protein RbmC n=1 Tax=Sandaracinus amylolyticus TaxID=927083 RepID=A0A0F6YIR4_9BACT|nr:Hemolysin-related protein RbmC [Sandaracinus amylolyticus]